MLPCMKTHAFAQPDDPGAQNENQDQDDKGNNKIIEGSYIETDVRPALPGPSEAEEPVEEEDLEDITDDILGDDEKDGYDYEDPEE